MGLPVSDDEDLNDFLEDVVSLLNRYFDWPLLSAELLVRDYFSKLQDPEYCSAHGFVMHDHDYYFHECTGGMAVRMHYHLGMKGDPTSREFLEWRKEFWSSYHAARQSRISRSNGTKT